MIKGKFDTDKIHTALKKEAEKKDSEIELVMEGGTQLYQFKAHDQSLCTPASPASRSWC